MQIFVIFHNPGWKTNGLLKFQLYVISGHGIILLDSRRSEIEMYSIYRNITDAHLLRHISQNK